MLKGNIKPKKGQMVRMISAGAGFGTKLVGQIAKIKKVGKFSFHYDVILDSKSNKMLIGEQCSGEESSNGFKGCASESLELVLSKHKKRH